MWSSAAGCSQTLLTAAADTVWWLVVSVERVRELSECAMEALFINLVSLEQ